MKTNTAIPHRYWIAVGVSVILSWVLVYAFASNQVLSSSDKAAWVQAIFSVVAIFAAIWISKAERIDDALSRRRSEKESVVSIVVIINRGSALVKAMTEIREGGASEALLYSIQVLAEKLESLDLIVRPSPLLLRCSLHSANYLRMYMHRARAGRFADHANIVRGIDTQSELIMAFYKITESDFPKSAE